MANTYTQIHIQAVFAVKYRKALVQNDWKNELYKYITGIVQGNEHRLLSINGMPDHVHVFFGMRPTQSLSDLLQDIKTNSSKWINEREFVKGRFEWQQGFGAFSYSKSQCPIIINYIRNQETHHQKVTFLEEYRKVLEEFSIAYDERYIFRELE